MKYSKLLFALFILIFNYSGFSQSKKPNIIIILVDDMGFSDVSTFGGNFVPTPNIDRLAKSGLVLNQYYSGAPICSPSRVSLLTGMYPGRWNFSTYLDNKKHNKNAEQADYLDPKAPSIARVFQSAGYTTGHFGKWHMGGGRDVNDAPGFEEYGYDAYASTYESPQPDPLLTASNWIWSDKDSIKRWDRTQYFVDKTLSFFKENKNKPRFVNLWPDDVHTPWVPFVGEEYTGKFPMGQESEHAFKLVLKELDKQVGRLIDGLKEMGEDKNTIIIFTSDNGPLPSFKGSRTGGLRGSKLSLYEGGTRMPFLISWPGHIPLGKTDAVSEVNAIDLLPSLAKMAAIKLPADYSGDGIDRSKVFAGSPSLRKKNMFWEYGRNEIAFKYPAQPNRSPSLAVRSGEWKLLMNSDGSDVQLYNIVKDRSETTELSGRHVKITNQLRSELSAWWKSLPKLKN
ncbi:arylsulfatase A-like enzyme [Pedobacter sp. W3I1]|uniref:sulfatase-like hydrolase/transferase n=1 Tax=Pedobacter sp. W3I1 TaxID=3042291 RepID=UPI00278B63E4|nr:sulfatase-like hydrolase/transferase [Pedobacter sp. W3I1]MDQ0639724.1 arylsulfatase A-like enzyme [Pedobacter sp. W3I1]